MRYRRNERNNILAPGTIYSEQPGANTAKMNQVSTLQKLNHGRNIKKKNPVVKEKDIRTLSPPPPLIQITSLTAKSASKL